MTFPRALVIAVTYCLLTIACTSDGRDASIQQYKKGDGFKKALLKQPSEKNFAIGDTFTYDNPQTTWRINGITSNRLLWESDSGERMETSTDPFLPAFAWQSLRYGNGRRSITQISGSLFPIKKGNSLRFVANTSFSGKKRSLTWNCIVGEKQQTPTPAGIFDTFDVLCQRKNADALIYKYSPALARIVEFRTPGLGLAPVIQRQLISYDSIAGIVHSSGSQPVDRLPPIPLSEDEQVAPPFRPNLAPVAPLPFAQPPTDFFAPQLDSLPEKGPVEKPIADPLKRILEERLKLRQQQKAPLLPQFTPQKEVQEKKIQEEEDKEKQEEKQEEKQKQENEDKSEKEKESNAKPAQQNTSELDTQPQQDANAQADTSTEKQNTTSAVRLGEYASLSQARQAWQKLSGEFKSVFSGRRYDITRSNDGAKGILYAVYVYPYVNSEAAEDACLAVRKKYRLSACSVTAWKK